MIRKSSVRTVISPCKRGFNICCKTKQQKSIGLLPPQNDINSSAHIKQPTPQKKEDCLPTKPEATFLQSRKNNKNKQSA